MRATSSTTSRPCITNTGAPFGSPSFPPCAGLAAQWFLVPGTTDNTVRIAFTHDGERIRYYGSDPVGLAAANNEQPQTEWRVVAHQHDWQLRHSADLADILSWPVLNPAPFTTEHDGDIDWIRVTPPTSGRDRQFYVLEVITP